MLEHAFFDDLFDMYMCARNARGNIEVSAYISVHPIDSLPLKMI